MSYRGVLVGCGFFARNHMHAWTRLPGVEMVAVCDRDQARAREFAEAFGVQAYTDAETMLAEHRPDFTDVVTTVESHRELVELAAAHSRLVICQKPFAENLSDGAAMVDACSRAGVPLMVHENFRWQMPFRAIRERLDAGVIGEPVFLRLSFRHAHDIYVGQPYLAHVQDLALMDVGLHLFDLSRFLLGDAHSVHCRSQRLNPNVKGQDAFVASLAHGNGSTSVIDCSFYSHSQPDPFPQTLARLEGTEGTLELNAGYALREHTRKGVSDSSVEPAVPSWGDRPWHAIQESVSAFDSHVLDVLDRKAEPQPSGSHNLQTLALTLAAIDSARQGEVISLSDRQGLPA